MMCLGLMLIMCSAEGLDDNSDIPSSSELTPKISSLEELVDDAFIDHIENIFSGNDSYRVLASDETEITSLFVEENLDLYLNSDYVGLIQVMEDNCYSIEWEEIDTTDISPHDAATYTKTVKKEGFKDLDLSYFPLGKNQTARVYYLLKGSYMYDTVKEIIVSADDPTFSITHLDAGAIYSGYLASCSTRKTFNSGKTSVTYGATFKYAIYVATTDSKKTYGPFGVSITSSMFD
jgi:hypothetical protein